MKQGSGSTVGWICLVLVLSSPAAWAEPAAPGASAEEDAEEMTVYGTNRSVISASPLTDTRAIESTAKIEKSELEDGLKAGESQVDREITPGEKPKMDESKREKLDVTPAVEYRVDWKLTLLIGLLEASGE